jgi:hypothetical protein
LPAVGANDLLRRQRPALRRRLRGAHLPHNRFRQRNELPDLPGRNEVIKLPRRPGRIGVRHSDANERSAERKRFVEPADVVRYAVARVGNVEPAPTVEWHC